MVRDTAKRVLEIESRAIAGVARRLNRSFDDAVDRVLECRGRIVVTGMGKSGIICHKIAATLSATGTPAYFMHPAEAIHGDLGMIVEGDLLLAVSNSGETEEIVRLLEIVRRLGASIIAMTGDSRSTLARHADLHLDVSVDQEACPLDLVPTASTTAALALGDALAVACYEQRGFSTEDFARYHPGGRLGRRVLQVRELMHVDDHLPRVRRDAPLSETIREMSAKKLGMTCVIDGEGSLVGVVTDGDLRRRVLTCNAPLQGVAADAMTPSPPTIGPEELASRALGLMEEKKITSLPVTDESNKLVGVIQIHDLWRTELF